MASGVYLFQGNYLVVPESAGGLPDAGVDKGLAGAAFGQLDYREVPSFAGEPGIRGALLGADVVIPPGWRTFSVRQAVAESSGAGRDGVCAGVPASPVLRLYHVLQWREESRFCGSCGSPNGDSPEELARVCPRCGRVEYPRISPAVIVLVTNDRGEALLAHNRKFSKNVYSLVAGFNEAGENLEATAVREIREEVGIEIKDLRFVTSQSWPFPNSLMVGFTARYAGGKLECDGIEITGADWFSAESVRDGVPELPAPGSVSRFIIDAWLAEVRPGEKTDTIGR
ncbi:MAG: NAD(+) diphosphatase [Treponema sp.]|jgi:NAD+ diphosphatase|nr:NAD(+) diphosphatase [Treponema sp.]